jgi:hypothetical protein
MNEVNKVERVRRCRQILDRSINFVHFIHVDVSDSVDKSWTEASILFTYIVGHIYMNEVNKAYTSVHDLSTPSDTST